MSTEPSPIQADKPGSPPTRRVRSFYSAAAILLLALMLVGFRNFYLHGRETPSNNEINPSKRNLVIVHGVVMTSWVLVFTIQPLLVLKKNLRVHRLLGWLGAALAVCVVGFGFWVWMPSSSPDESDVVIWWEMTPKQFSGYVLSTIAIFAGFVAVGIANRKRPAVHRPMMLMGTLAIMAAAFDRIPWITSLYYDSPFTKFLGPYTGPLGFGLLLLCAKCLLARSFDRYLALSCAAFTGAVVVAIAFVKSSIWIHIYDFLTP